MRNKRTFVIIVILSLIIIGIFSLIIYKYKHAAKIEYNVEAGSIVQDNDKNYLETNEDALLKVRWNGNYYLVYQDRKIGLGKKVIVFNPVSKGIKLYGKFYEIGESGKIVYHNNETSLRNSVDTKFMKLDDREYLLIDTEIKSNDDSIDAKDYLLVELDRMGNAKLSNYKLNLKTITPTTLQTSKYSFDIANEILKFASKDIDLKKIIGSTNEYKEDEKKKEAENDDDNAGGAGDGTNQVTANGAGAGATATNNASIGGKYISIEELIKNVKTTSIVRAYEGMREIDINYVVYDPYNEYKDIYAEIDKEGTIERVEVVRTDTHMVFEGLKADTDYKINFYYTTIDSETNNEVKSSFGSLDMHTKKPQYGIVVTRVSGVTNKLYYKVYLQEDYPIDTMNVTLSIDDVVIATDTISGIGGSPSSIPREIYLGDYEISNKQVTLEIIDVTGPDGAINVGSYTTFRLGR